MVDSLPIQQPNTQDFAEKKLRSNEPTTLLVTGATGHLGGRILDKLCSKFRCVCIARDPQRLPKHPNLEAISGDLSENFDWGAVPETDAILHCAGVVNTVLPLESLRATNLDCLVGLVAYASRGRVKPIHFASTLSVFVSTDFVGLAKEDDQLNTECQIFGGYAQSKWAAENYLRRWNGPVHFYRYGLLLHHPTHDFVELFLRGIQRFGCYPRGSTIRLDMTPIEFASEATVQFLLASFNGERPEGSTYHIASSEGRSLESLLHGLNLKPVSPTEFFSLPARTPEEALTQLALCRLHPDPSNFERHRSLDLFQATDVQFELRSLENRGLYAPEPDMERYRKFR